MISTGSKCDFTTQLRVPPGEELVVRWNEAAGNWRILQPDDELELLPDSALEALIRAPKWLRDDLRLRFADLLFDILPARGYRDFRFVDIRDQNYLVMQKSTGGFEYYLAPHWIPLDGIEPSRSRKHATQWFSQDMQPIRYRNSQYRLDADSRLVTRRQAAGTFWDYIRAIQIDEIPAVKYCAVPWPVPEGFLVGDQSGVIRHVTIENGEVKRSAEICRLKNGLNAAPTAADLDDDGEMETLSGSREGTLEWLNPDLNKQTIDRAGIEELDAGGYTVPCFHDFNRDGIPDLVVGNQAGEIRWFEAEISSGKWRIDREQIWDPPFQGNRKDEPRYTGTGAIPRFRDMDDDGEPDLVVGTVDGDIRMFRGPDWLDLLPEIKCCPRRSFAAPAWTESGAIMVLGDRDGQLSIYKVEGGIWRSTAPWRFVPSRIASNPEEYYDRYYREWEELRSPLDSESVERFARLILNAEPELLDEIAFTIAHTPTEILRAMSRMEFSDIPLINARELYRIVEKLPYVRLKENPEEGKTTLEYRILNRDEWLTMPFDIYYWWVLHPRILYEIPSRLDPWFWNASAEERGLTENEWWRHEEDFELLRPSARSRFWRSVLPYDRRYGDPLMQYVRECQTVEAALHAYSDWMSRTSMHGFMEFGYSTDDIQPLLIYAKHYGSCGEQAILTAAALRSILIPAAHVGARGEDHAWNEWWSDGNWRHLDVNSDPHEVGHNWVWREHTDHSRPVSIVVRNRGDDAAFPVTGEVLNPPGSRYTTSGRGYTDTGTVQLTVIDSKSNPVEAAMVIVRSQNRASRDIAYVQYTDHHGTCVLNLGEQLNGGYTFEVISAAGMAGISDFHVEEGTQHPVTIRVPGEAPAWPENTGSTMVSTLETGSKLRFKVLSGFLTPPNFHTSKQSRLNTTLGEKTGFRGTRWYCHTLDSLPELTVVSEAGKIVGVDGILPFKRSQVCRIGIPGAYRTGAMVELTVPDGWSESDTKAEPDLLPATEYLDFPIRQDDPDSPLPECSFMLGPFTLPANERFFQVKSTGRTDGLDLDLFVFEDKNGDREIQEDEKLAESTTPTAEEKITIEEPGEKVLWILGQGWSVPDPGQQEALLDRVRLIDRLRNGEPAKMRFARADFRLSALPVIPVPESEASERSAAGPEPEPSREKKRLTIKEQELAVSPHDGCKTIDIRQVIAVYFKRKPARLSIRIDAEDITGQLHFTPTSARFFPQSDWTDGNHLIEVSAQLAENDPEIHLSSIFIIQ